MSTTRPATVDLGSARCGRIWARQPSSDAVELARFNLKSSKSGTSPPAFTAVASDPWSDIVALGDVRGNVTLVDAGRNTFQRFRVAQGDPITSLCFISRSKEVVASLASGAVLVLHLGTGSVVARLPHRRPGHAPDGPVLVASDGLSSLSSFDPGRVSLWAPTAQQSSWEQTQCLAAPTPSGRFLAVRMLPEIVAVLCDSDRILGWRTQEEDFPLAFSLQVPAEERAGLSCFAASSELVVAGGRNAMVYLFDPTTEVLLRVVEMPQLVQAVVQVEVLRASPGRCALLGDDGSLLVVDCDESGCAVELELNHRSAVAFAVSERSAVSVGGPSARLFDLAAGKRASRRGGRPVDSSLFVRRGGDPGVETPARPPCTHRGEPSRAHLAAAPAAVDLPAAELAKVLEASKKLTRGGVLALLESQGRFPSKHRPLLWRFILQLPENASAFGLLVAKGSHPACEDLDVRYPLRDSRVMRRLTLVVSALAHHSPLIAGLEYLPATAFPFVIFFAGDDLAAFEATLSVLSHWQRHFLCCFPHPPVPLLHSVEAALRLHDPQLIAHLVAIGAGPQVYAWPLLRSAFTEVLPREVWLGLWDHIISWPNEPGSLALAAVALLLEQRSTLLAMESVQQLSLFLATEWCVVLRSTVLALRRLRAHQPTTSLLSNLELRVDGIDEGVSANVSTGPFPLPGGSQYPPVRGYPRFALDYQIEQRKRLEKEEAAGRARDELLAEVARRADELSDREKAWAAQRATLNELEQSRREQAREAHLLDLTTRAAAEQAKRRSSLAGILGMEAAAAAALERSVVLSEDAAARASEELSASLAAADVSIRSLADEEAVAREIASLSSRLESSATLREEEALFRQVSEDLDRRREALVGRERNLLSRWDAEDAAALTAASELALSNLQAAKGSAFALPRDTLKAEFGDFESLREARIVETERLRQARLAKAAELRSLLEESSGLSVDACVI